jgi:hypothetical protein
MKSLQRILPEPVPDAVEKAFSDKLNAKVRVAVELLVTSVRAIQAAYGSEGVDLIHAAIRNQCVDIGKARAKETSDHSLRAFCSTLEIGCSGSHEWTKVESSDSRQTYHFTQCLWADLFRYFNAPEIGYMMCCEGDEATAQAFNPEFRFSRSKTLMQGDDCCDHAYHL